MRYSGELFLMRCSRSSRRWNQVYIGLLAGYPYQKIASNLKLSIPTIRQYATGVFQDLECHNRAELQANAVRAAVDGKLKIHLTGILGETWTRKAVKAIREEKRNTVSLSSLLFDFVCSAGSWTEGFILPDRPLHPNPLEWVPMNAKEFAQNHADHVVPSTQSLRKNLDKAAALHFRLVAETVSVSDLAKKLEASPFPPTDPTSVTQVHTLLGDLSAGHKRISALLSEQISIDQAIIKDQTVLTTALDKQQGHLEK